MSSTDDRLRTVPKFGSFKPKEPVKPESESGSKVEAARVSGGRGSKDERRHKSRRRDGDRHDHQSHHDGRREKDTIRPPESYRHDQMQKHRSGEPKPIDLLRETRNTGDERFTIDKRGDPLIRRYKSNDRSRVPVYRILRRRIILGSPGYLEIQNDGPRELFSIRTTGDGRSAFRDKSLLALAGKTKSRLFRNSTRQSPSAADLEFIALEPPRKRKRSQDADADSSSGRERKSYRSIEGKAKPQEDSDSAFESDSGDAGAEGYYITPSKRRAIELSRTVKQRPADIAAWLELINLQDVLFTENEENGHVRTRDEVKALADIKVSMYEKALLHAGSKEDREEVLVRLMREGSRVWKPQVVAKRWAEVIQQNSDSFALWKSHMDFELSNISAFSVDDAKARFIDRLRSVEGKLSSSVDDGAGECHLTEEAIYIFLRLTCLLHETGSLDLAVAAWQAMLELVFARPTLTDDGRETVMASLGEFWDSEVPRLGEPGATGWRKFVDNGGVGDLPEAKPKKQTAAPGELRDVYKAWAATEHQQALQARMPAKTVDEGTEDDPFRVVMFGDIEPFLALFPTSILHRIRRRLVDAYLLFCHLPPASRPASGVMASAPNDRFIYGGSRDFERTIDRSTDSADVGSERKGQAPDFQQDGACMAISPAVLFSGHGWFSYLPTWPELYPHRDEPIERSYILETLRQLVLAFGLEEVAEYHLALEWLNDPAKAKKAAKTVLKQYPSNIALYNAYAMMEWANGNAETSHKVLRSAIGMASGATEQMLKNTWAMMELDAARLTKALQRVCGSGQANETETVTPALMLKTRSELSAKRVSCLTAGSPDQALPYAVGLVLLNYLSSANADTDAAEPQSDGQGSIAAAMDACDGFSAELTTRGLRHSCDHELFLQFAARLIYYHATHGPFRPVYIREQLQRYVVLFPRNTIFLSIFAWAESSLRIDDPVRALLRSTSLAEAHDCLSSRVFAIRHELRVGNAHSARAAFESALGSEACKGSAWLWRCYLRFCSGRRELRAKAKDVFYRAVAACPGSKRLYLEAFATLEEHMAGSELQAILSTISSKNLRVHVDFESFAKAWGGSLSVTGHGNLPVIGKDSL